jgi:hypothetical protein
VLTTRRSGDIASGAVLAVLGLVAAWASTDIDEGAGGHLHPRSFPLFVGVLLFLGGAALVVRNLDAKAGGGREIDWPDPAGWKLWLGALGALALYVALAPVLGFLVTSFLFVGGLIWYLGRYNPLIAAVWALGVVVFVYVAFVWLLDLALPPGLLATLVFPG